MQYVTPEYKESMRQPLRDRGYIRVVFGGTSSQAQNTAVISGDQLFYSDSSQVFNNGLDNFVYATLEENFTKLDGSKYFYSPYVNQQLEKAFISEDIVTNSYQFTISFENPVSFDTLIFNFGENYPLAFTITDSDNNTYTYENDTGRIFEIDQTFTNITELQITITEMLNPNTRFRLYSLRFSFGLEYQNDMIMDSNLDSSFSPICETLPQMNFNVKLVNEDHYFDPDNPKSILNQFDTSTEVNVYYGYQLSNRIEWLQAAKLYVENWNSDRESATISARDILQANDKEYTGGNFASITLYNLAVAIFAEMGISDYSIDESLQNVTTINSFTKISCKEALQIIANAACKKLFIRRDGSIRIGDEIYTYTFSSNGTLPFSNVASIETNDTKYDYAALEENYTKVNGTLYFSTPYVTDYKNVGYVSEQISDAYKLFRAGGDIGLSEAVLRNNILSLPYTLGNAGSGTVNPKITITLGEASSIGGLHILFGDTYSTRFLVRFFEDDTVLGQIGVINNQKEVTIEFDGYGDKIEVEFVETVEPYNRVRVKYIQVLKSYNSARFDEIDLMSYPQFERFETLQKLVVPYYTYSNGEATEHIVEEAINAKGSVVKWENPLITTQAMAQNLLAWLKDYYLLDGTYNFDIRGNPEIDVNDDATQVKYDGTFMKVLITDISVGFNGAFSGSVKTLKKGDVE